MSGRNKNTTNKKSVPKLHKSYDDAIAEVYGTFESKTSKPRNKSNKLSSRNTSKNIAHITQDSKLYYQKNSGSEIYIPELTNPPIHDNAYVWLLMRGDAYLPGIFVSAYSVLRTSPAADLVIMVTDDVSENAVNALKKVSTHIVVVPYLTFITKKLKTEKQQSIYGSWIADSYTKWNMLALPYKKTLFIDGDTIITANIDNLFELQTPAAPFGNSFVKPIGTINDYLKGRRGPDGYLQHNAIIKPFMVNNILTKNGMGLTASAVLLSPSIDDFNLFIKIVKSLEPFGYTTCHNGFDEQSIMHFYAIVKHQNWTNIHQRYNLIAWKEGFLSKGDIPFIIHYLLEKPWTASYNKWNDFICWYKMASESLKETKLTATDIKLKDENIIAAEKADDKFIKIFTDSVDNVLELVNVL